jgi:hypothetical protein
MGTPAPVSVCWATEPENRPLTPAHSQNRPHPQPHSRPTGEGGAPAPGEGSSTRFRGSMRELVRRILSPGERESAVWLR